MRDRKIVRTDIPSRGRRRRERSYAGRRRRRLPRGTRPHREVVTNRRVDEERTRQRRTSVVVEKPSEHAWARRALPNTESADRRDEPFVGTGQFPQIVRTATVDGAARYLRDSGDFRGPGSAYFRPVRSLPGHLFGQNGDYPNDWHCRVLTKAAIFRRDRPARTWLDVFDDVDGDPGPRTIGRDAST